MTLLYWIISSLCIILTCEHTWKTLHILWLCKLGQPSLADWNQLCLTMFTCSMPCPTVSTMYTDQLQWRPAEYVDRVNKKSNVAWCSHLLISNQRLFLLFSRISSSACMLQCGFTFSVAVIVVTANDQMTLQKSWLHAQTLDEIFYW